MDREFTILRALLHRFVPALAGVACLAALTAPLASAHVGELKTAVSAGPYRLVVRALPVRTGSRPALTFRSSLTERRTEAPVADATVRLFIRNPSGIVQGPYRMSGLDGSYYLIVPIANANTWRQLRFRIDVDGPLGTGSGLYVPPNLFRQWLLEPGLLAGAAIAAALFGWGFLRLRRRGRGDHASWDRAVLFLIGLCLLVLPLVSPLDIVGDHFLLSAHMLQHVLIGDAAPAVLLVALRGPLLSFAVPRPLLRQLGHAVRLRRALAWLLRPKPALALWALSYGGWHIPAAYDYAATHQTVHDLEHASFIAAGFLVWALLIDPARRRRLSSGQRLAVAALLFLMGSVISDVLIFSFRPLYPAYAQQAERVFSLSPLRDQQLAGLVMAVDQLVTLGTFAAIVLWLALRDRRRTQTLIVAGPPLRRNHPAMSRRPS